SVIDVEGCRNGQFGSGNELGIRAIGVVPEDSAIDPAPLDVTQMVDDTEKADQRILRSPPGLLIADAGKFAFDRATQIPQPVHQQFALVVRPCGKADVLLGCHSVTLPASL